MMLVQTIMLPQHGGGMMNQEEKRAYNRAYGIANKARIEANRAARRAGLGADVRRCSVPGCDGVYDAQGYCARHYMAFRRNGDPLVIIQRQRHGLTLEARFMSYVDQGPDCWEWTGNKNSKGYGFLNRAGGDTLAHRVSWTLLRGTIPDGLFVLHRCDNPGCVNPDHLFLGTKADNNTDMWTKGRGAVGEAHPMAKLTPAIVQDIRASVESNRALAGRYGVSAAAIRSVRSRKNWKHIK